MTTAFPYDPRPFILSRATTALEKTREAAPAALTGKDMAMEYDFVQAAYYLIALALLVRALATIFR